jgi:hypothetical protein
MAKPIDLSLELNREESIRFVEELIRVESLPEDSPELKQRRDFLKECVEKANKVNWRF